MFWVWETIFLVPSIITHSFQVKMIFQDSHYNHVFDSIGLSVIGEVVEGYENSDTNSDMTGQEMIEAKLSLWIVNDSKVLLAKIEFDNGYQHVFDSDCPQLKIFQDAYIGKEWHLPDDEDFF